LFDFTLTFTARRFNLREHFIAGFLRLTCSSLLSDAPFAKRF
jgi:hypothetical protein